MAAALTPFRAHLTAVQSAAAADPAESAPTVRTATILVNPSPADVTSPATPDPVRSSRFVVGTAIWVLGALVLGFLGYLAGLSSLTENRAQAVLFDKLRYELAHGTAPTAGPVPSGDPVAVLSIPSLHVKQVVVEGASSRSLMSGPGHEPGTVLPGQIGTSVVLGRRETFGAPFRHLNELRSGDLIYVASGAGQLTYSVDSLWRSDRSHIAPPPVKSRLTLITSDPAWRPGRSLVVTAALKSGTPGTAAVSSVASAADQPLGSDHGVGLSLYLWSQLAFFAVFGLLRYHGRVRRSVLWIGGLPVLLVVLLHIYPDLAALLPNTL
jgi:sortase A